MNGVICAIYQANSNLTANCSFKYDNKLTLVLDWLTMLIMGLNVDPNAEANSRGKFYTGCQLFSIFTVWTGLPLDQINFILACLLSILISFIFRFCAPPSRVSVILRAYLEAIIGIAILAFCFGSQIRVLILQAVVAYFILLLVYNERRAAICVMLWSFFYLITVHLCRLYYDYQGYTMDISGPVMIQTQRLTSLAFCISDGCKRSHQSSDNGVLPGSLTANNEEPVEELPIEDASKSNLSKGCPPRVNHTNEKYCKNSTNQHATKRQQNVFHDQQLEHAVFGIPRPFEFAAYNLYFHGACIGPFVFYSDYRNYLAGYADKQLPPVKVFRFLFVIIKVIVFGLGFAFLSRQFPVLFLVEDAFLNSSIFFKVGYTTVSFICLRMKYYFAWSFAEAIGMAAGHGYTGDDPETGAPIWKNIINVDVLGVEAALNLKLLIDNWNITTVRWLREVVYFRSPTAFKTLAVFITSAIWHGLYPGYYLMFLTFALFTFASRAWRRAVRPRIIEHRALHIVYNIVTIVVTHLLTDYTQAPFHLLGFWPSIVFWKQFYFLPHILAILILSAISLITYFANRMSPSPTRLTGV